jgi:phosphoribosylanthranilate isomerase
MTKVKICGITNVEDARVAVEAGADFLGFIFYPKSPRYVTPEKVREIVTQYLIPNIHMAGVFVNQEAEAVAQTLEFCGLDYAQLHGVESPQAVSALVERGYGVIKALRVRDGSDLSELERYPATAYLLDTYVAGQPGGTGLVFDWKLAAQAVQYGPIMLAGGLTPGNVAQAIQTAQPWAVDVSSGVEAAPGRKDHDKVRRFVRAAKLESRTCSGQPSTS